MRKKKRFLHYATTLLIVGALSIVMGTSGFVGADTSVIDTASLVTSLVVFGGVTIGLSALLFMSAMSIEK